MQHACKIRAALVAVIALAVIAAFSSTPASAATSRQCQPNPYTPGGRICIEHQVGSQATPLVVAKKAPHKAAKKQSSSQCLAGSPYGRWVRCG
jgi:hypothetical protein